MANKQIIQLLEDRYVEQLKEFDRHIEQNNKLGGNSAAMEEAQHCATITCEIAHLLAEINGTSEDTEHNRLYNKYNLYKTE